MCLSQHLNYIIMLLFIIKYFYLSFQEPKKFPTFTPKILRTLKREDTTDFQYPKKKKKTGIETSISNWKTPKFPSKQHGYLNS